MDGDNSRSKFSIDLSYDPQDGVWSGTSKYTPGFFLETDSFTELLCEAKDIAPYLISQNLNITEGEILICIITDNISPLRKERGSSFRTTYALQEETIEAVAMAR